MPRYIDADALKNELISSGAIGDFGLYLIDIQPAADVRPERHGEWIPLSDDDQYEGCYSCSACNTEEFFHDEILSNYCPHCGAKMDRGEKNG